MAASLIPSPHGGRWEVGSGRECGVCTERERGVQLGESRITKATKKKEKKRANCIHPTQKTWATNREQTSVKESSAETTQQKGT